MIKLFSRFFKQKSAVNTCDQNPAQPEYFYFRRASTNCFEPTSMTATRGSDADITEELERRKIYSNGGTIRYCNIVDMKADIELLNSHQQQAIKNNFTP